MNSQFYSHSYSRSELVKLLISLSHVLNCTTAQCHDIVSFSINKLFIDVNKMFVCVFVCVICVFVHVQIYSCVICVCNLQV